MIAAALDSTVRQHDDGSRPGMHDLDIEFSDGHTGAVEVTAAADQSAVEHWNLMNGGGRWIVDTLRGGWSVEVRIGSSWKRLKAQLPSLLAELEADEIVHLVVDDAPVGNIEALASRLGIVHAEQHATSFAGSIYITFDMPLDRVGGAVADNSDALAPWCGEFLREPKQADVLRKLAAAADRDEHHAFIFLPGFNVAPFAVNDALLRSDLPVPRSRPDLPPPVTHVWVVSMFTAGIGYRWDPNSGWFLFDKRWTTAAGSPSETRFGDPSA